VTEAAPRVDRVRRLGALFTLEDAVLFVWVVFIEEYLVRRFGPELGLIATGASEPRWLVALTAGGLAVALFTRGPADTTIHQASSRRCVVSLILWFGARQAMSGSMSWSAVFLAWFLVGFVVLAPLNALERMPRTGLGVRRLLVLPAQLVGNSVFATQVTPEFLQGTGPALGILFAAFLFLYAVVGPRVLAGQPWTPIWWLLRFGLYVGALLLGRPEWARWGR
jgi:hypothetical protein